MAKKSFLFSWTKFWANMLVSATVEAGDTDGIVLTFKSVKPFTNCVAGEFTSTGTVRTCSEIAIDTAAKTVTLTMSEAYAGGNTINLVFNPVRKGATITQSVTNNIPE